MEKTYQIPKSNLITLTTTLDRLAARARKIGVGSITYTCSAPTNVPWVQTMMEGWVRWTPDLGALENFERARHRTIGSVSVPGGVKYRSEVTVTVSGTIPRLAGWEFVGTLQHLSAEGDQSAVLLRTVPGVAVPVEYRTASPENCDHCRKRIRSRKETFLVRSGGDTWRQVGRTCLQDFVGGEDPHSVASVLTLLLDANSAAESAEGDGFGGGGRRVDGHAIRHFLAVVALLVRVEGWVSRKMAREALERNSHLPATSKRAMWYLEPPMASRAYQDWFDFTIAHPITDADWAVADAALSLAREELVGDTLTDYEHNLSVACRLPSVDDRTSGIVASLINLYLRRHAVSTQQPSTHVGAVGQRDFFLVKLERVIPSEGAYGTTYIHKFKCLSSGADSLRGRGERSDDMTWFASCKQIVPEGESHIEMVEGVTYVIRATVKEHDEYRGRAQTIVSKGTVLSDEEVSRELAKIEKKSRRIPKTDKNKP